MLTKNLTKKSSHIKINRTKELALRLGIPLKTLEDVAQHIQSHSQPFQKKVGHKIRTLYTTSASLAHIHKRIEQEILDKFDFPTEFKGGIKGRSLLDNAKVHSHKINTASIDIKNFFPSVKPGRIYKAFYSLGCAPKVANLLTTFVSVDGHLPQGFATSPKVAYLVLIGANKRIKNFLVKYGVAVSFWIDDINISGSYPVKKLLPAIKKIVSQEDFIAHKDKGPMYRSNRQTVTGIVVNDKPAPIKQNREDTRKILYLCEKYGIKSYIRKYISESITVKNFVLKMSGRISYMISIDKKKYTPWAQKWNTTVKDNGLGIYLKSTYKQKTT